MSKFFEDVGDLITSPFRETYGYITGDPKYNSPGDIWNRDVGPGNALQNTVSDVAKLDPLSNFYQKSTGADLSAPFQGPTWEDLGKPGQAFSESVNQTNKILPSSWQPYAQPIEAIGLSAFNPFAGAAFQTAYQGGQEQEQQKGFDWGELGKNAAINFGTAGVASLANEALSSANSAREAGSALNDFNHGASSALQSTVDSARASTQGALSAFNPGAIASSSLSAIPYAQGLQQSGQGIADAAYTGSLKAAQPLANAALNATLNPPGSAAISDTTSAFAPITSDPNGSQQYGDLLNAFGGGEVNTANPYGPRIDTQAFNDSVNRLSANSFLQQNQVRDTALPAGQFQAPQNTPYANQLTDINKGTTQAYADLLDQTNNANSYYSILDSNPGLTSDQLNTYLQNPTSGSPLGNFSVSPDEFSFLQNIHPLGPLNSSLLTGG